MVGTNGFYESLVTKLHPRGFTAMSGKMAAIVGYVLDQPRARRAGHHRRWIRPGPPERRHRMQRLDRQRRGP